MASINEDFYNDKHFSPCTGIEKNIIEYIKSSISNDYSDIIKRDERWAVTYQLSLLRTDLISWYPFKKDCNILEIGADLGAFTGTLCEKAASVIATEASKEKARCIIKRYLSCQNLEVFVASITEIKFIKKFDYIIIENLEIDISLEIFLKSILKLLVPNGKLLIIVEDSFSYKQLKDEKVEIEKVEACSLLTMLKTYGYTYSNIYFPYTYNNLSKKKYSNLPQPDPRYINAKEFLKKTALIEASISSNIDSSVAFDIYEKKINDEYINYLKTKLITYDKKIEQLSLEVDTVKNTIWWKMIRKASGFSKFFNKCKIHSKIANAAGLVFKNGIQTTVNRLSMQRTLQKTYNTYIFENEITKNQLQYERELIFKNPIKFSIVCPLYNTPSDYLKALIDSVIAQTYGKFELCFADGSDKENEILDIINSYNDNRILYKKLDKNAGIADNTNECIKMTTGDYIGFIDHDDKLDQTALFEYMKTINNTKADFIYCDEDKFKDDNGKYFDPYFKPDFFIDNLRANNYICHFTVFKKELLSKTGLLVNDYDGSQDHDFVLKLAENASRIEHIPMILYHWRVSDTSVAKNPNIKDYTALSGQKAVMAHLNRMNIDAKITSSVAHPNIYKITYKVNKKADVVIIIRSNGNLEMLEVCIASIIKNANYVNYKILIMGNVDVDYSNTLKKSENIKLITTLNQINYGEYIIFLKENVIIKDFDFIMQMLSYTQREDVAVTTIKGYDSEGKVIEAPFTKGMSSDENAKIIYHLLDKTQYGYFGRMCYTFNINHVKKDFFMIKRELFLNLDLNTREFSKQIRQKGLICYNPNCSYKLL